MGRITQTKIIDDIIKTNIEKSIEYEEDSQNKKVLFRHGAVSVVEEDNTLYVSKPDEIVVFPYFLNLYDELEFFVCLFETNKVHNIKGCYAITSDINDDESPESAFKRTIEDLFVIEDNWISQINRIKRLDPFFVSKTMSSKSYPFFFDMTDLKYDMKKENVVKMDLFSANRFQIRDINLIYMLSVVKDI